LDSAIPK